MDILLIVVCVILFGVIWYYKEKAEEEYIRECEERGDIVIRIYKL